jgi:hypothetical protein
VEAGNISGELWDSFCDITAERGATIHNPESPSRLIGGAIVKNNYGRGKVVYLPFDLTVTYETMDSQQEHRLLLKAIEEELFEKPVIKVKAPTTVEAVKIFDEKKKRFILHLIGYNGGKIQSVTNYKRSEPMMYDAPMYRAKIELDNPIKKINNLRANTEIEKESDKIVSLVVEAVHEAIEIYV